jgi:hypothetical protein
MDRKQHWETVYETKNPDQVSWTQKRPSTSLDFISSFGADKTANIIDIGGGDSNLVDHLLDNGYQNITVLDISAKAIEKAQNRLGARADQVNWIVSDVVDFKPTDNFDIWHDRAAFHFLTSPSDISKYASIMAENAAKNVIIATFSENGPLKCSGLEISQYSEKSILQHLSAQFDLIDFKTEDHTTPFDTTQNFLYCSFKRK